MFYSILPNSNLKKILSILFLFIFIYNLLGYYGFFIIVQYQVRYEVKQKIKQSVPDEELILISVSINDNKTLTWIKASKEFRYNGEMYDVVKQEIKNKQILYYCIPDFKESKLFENLDEYIQKYVADNPKQNKETQNILKKLTNIYFFQAFFINSPLEFPYNLTYKKYLNTYKSICLEILNPPPEFA